MNTPWIDELKKLFNEMLQAFNGNMTIPMARVVGLDAELSTIYNVLGNSEVVTLTHAGLFATFHPPLQITRVKTLGYSTLDDKGGGVYAKMSTAPAPIKPWHKQDALGGWWELSTDKPNPFMFGGANEAALSACFDYAAAKNIRVIKGKDAVINIPAFTGSQKYLITRNIEIDNLTITTSALTSGQAVMAIQSPDAGTNILLTQDALVTNNPYQLFIPNTAGFVKGDKIFIESNGEFARDGSNIIRKGEMVIVSYAVSATELRLSEPFNCNYLLSDGAKIRKPLFLDDVRLGLGFKILGTPTAIADYGLRLARIANSQVDCGNVAGFGNSSITIKDCFDLSLVRSTHPVSTGVIKGLDYGVVLEGKNLAVQINNVVGSGTRHLVAMGGTDGFSKGIVYVGCNTLGSENALFDSHSACLDVTIVDCKGAMSAEAFSSKDGITIQCARGKVINFDGKNINRHGMAFESGVTAPEVTLDFECVNSRFACRNDGQYGTNSLSGILVNSVAGTNKVSRACFRGNYFSGFTQAAFVRSQSVNGIEGVTIEDNEFSKCTTRGVQIVSTAAPVIVNAIRGNQINVLQTTAAGEAIYLQGNATYPVYGGAVTDNILTGQAQIAIRADFTIGTHCEDNHIVGNFPIEYSTTSNNVNCVFGGNYPLRSMVSATVALVGTTLTIPNSETELVRVSFTSPATLSTIAAGFEGQIVILRTATSGAVLTVDENGNIRGNGSTYVLNNTGDRITLQSQSGTWFLLGYEDNA